MNPEKISIELDVQSWNIVASAMGKLPIEVGLDVFLEMKRQHMAAEAAKRDAAHQHSLKLVQPAE